VKSSEGFPGGATDCADLVLHGGDFTWPDTEPDLCDGGDSYRLRGDLIISEDAEDLSGLFCVCEVYGGLVIRDNDVLTNLAGLDALTSAGEMDIEANASLRSLRGLGSLSEVSDNVSITDNEALTSLRGLGSLSSVGRHLYIWNNDSLASLRGLESLSDVRFSVSIARNDGLMSLRGLESLSAVNSSLYISGNASLTSLSGLEALSSVNESLSINDNDALTSLSGLEALAAVDGDLYIVSNRDLPACLAEALVYDQVGEGAVGGAVIIRDNRDECPE